MAHNPLLLLLLVAATASAAVFREDASDKVKDGDGVNKDGNDDAVGA